MENNKKLGAGTVVGIVILAVLSVLGLFAEYFLMFKYYPWAQALVNLVPFTLLFALLIYYLISGYKKPHGDLMRYIFIFYGFSCIATSISSVAFDLQQMEALKIGGMMWIAGLMSLTAFLAGYIGGRLDKIRKNAPLLVVGTVVQLVVGISCIVHYQPFVSFWDIILDFDWCILWCDIVFAYVLRYREHKEAGLTDKN